MGRSACKLGLGQTKPIEASRERAFSGASTKLHQADFWLVTKRQKLAIGERARSRRAEERNFPMVEQIVRPIDAGTAGAPTGGLEVSGAPG